MTGTRRQTGRAAAAAFSFATLVSVVCGLLVLGALGCTDGGGGKGVAAKKVFQVKPGEKIRLAFVTNNASEFWKIADAGLEKARKEHGIDIILRSPPKGTVEEQKRILEDLVTEGYHGIAVSVISAADEVRDINKAATKTNVITHDSDAPGSNRLVYIGTDNYQAGRALGEEIVKLLPEGGKMAAFVGTLAADNASQRMKGIEDVIAGKNIEVVAKKEDNKDPAKARSNVEDVLTAFEDIDVLCGLWSYNGPAILAAAKGHVEAGKVQIVAFDEEEGTLKGIEEGHIVCTCVQKPFEFGYRSAVLLNDLAKRGEAALGQSDIIDTGVDIITSENVAEFKANLAKMTGK